jgi:hypothetical protein
MFFSLWLSGATSPNCLLGNRTPDSGWSALGRTLPTLQLTVSVVVVEFCKELDTEVPVTVTSRVS